MLKDDEQENQEAINEIVDRIKLEVNCIYKDKEGVVCHKTFNSGYGDEIPFEYTTNDKTYILKSMKIKIVPRSLQWI